MTTAKEQIRVSREWLELIQKLPDAGRVVIIGAADAGKTTLCRWLLSRLPESTHPVVVDADLGQTQVGAPGCVGWRFAAEKEHRFFFVGDTTPATTPAVALAATWRAVTEAAGAGGKFTLVDTSGYLGGRGGYELKSAKLELLAPAHVLLLGDSPEIKRLLAAWHRDERLTIHRLAQSDSIQQKTREERTQWRQERWAEQFKALDLRKISLKGKSLSGLPTASELKTRQLTFADLQGLLLGFHDRQRHGVCLGLLHSLDLRGQELVARAPAEAETAPGIMFGLLKLTAAGQELGRII
jgi:polynucleotide 5'-hydroxyl-kinase GRC3/NOL9